MSLDVTTYNDILYIDTEDKFNRKDEEGDPECSICLDKLKLVQVVRKLGCEHIFHKDCVRDLKNCPQCQRKIGERKVKILPVSAASIRPIPSAPPISLMNPAPSAPPISLMNPVSSTSSFPIDQNFVVPPLEERVNSSKGARNSPAPEDHLFAREIKNKYEEINSRSNFLGRVSSGELKERERNYQINILKGTESSVLLSPALQEKFNEYREVLVRLRNEAERNRFLLSLTEEENLEVLHILRCSNLSTLETRNFTKSHLTNVFSKIALFLANGIKEKYENLRLRTQGPRLSLKKEELEERINFQKRLLGEEGRLNLLDSSYKEKFNDYKIALTYLESEREQNQFLSSLPEGEQYEVLNILRCSNLSDYESKNSTESFFNKLSREIPQSLGKEIKKKYEDLNREDPRLRFLSESDKIERKRDSQRRLLDGDRNVYLASTFLQQKFHDYMLVLRYLNNERERNKFLASLEEEEQTEVLTLLRSSNLSTSETRGNTESYFNSISLQIAHSLAKAIRVQYELLSNKENLLLSRKEKELELKKSKERLLGEGEPMQVTSVFLKEKFQDYKMALSRLKSCFEKAMFFSTLKKEELLEVLSLLHCSNLSNQESREQSHSYLSSISGELALSLARYVKEYYEEIAEAKNQSDSLTEKEKEAKLKLYKERLFGEKEFFEAESPFLKDKFEAYKKALSRLKFSTEKEAFFSTLKEEEALEVLNLLHCSSLSNKESREQSQFYLSSILGTLALSLAKYVKNYYEAIAEAKNQADPLTEKEKEARLKLYKERLFGEKGVFKADSPFLKEKFEAYKKALNRLKFDKMKKQFLSTLKKEEALEVLNLLHCSSLSDKESKELTQDYLSNILGTLALALARYVKEHYEEVAEANLKGVELSEGEKETKLKIYKERLLEERENFQADTNLLKEKFEAYRKALNRLNSDHEKEIFLSTLKEDEVLEVLNLLHCSNLSSQESKQEVGSYLLSIVGTLAFSLAEYTRNHYERLNQAEEEEEDPLFEEKQKDKMRAYNEGLLLGTESLVVDSSFLKQKFEDYKVALNRLKSNSEVERIFSTLKEGEALEVLSLFRCSDLSTKETRDLLESCMVNHFKYRSAKYFFTNISNTVYSWGAYIASFFSR
ncbi:hypothetical protein AB751O23_AJ_00180 [Chlamydiales bacterium SCGC AB-751-O23]|jgi:hypothetical protein|nr:hypothetical protein AB751O23_AJ_00180 [Chlamydiales bacterium SCGC AB-751-O23]